MEVDMEKSDEQEKENSAAAPSPTSKSTRSNAAAAVAAASRSRTNERFVAHSSGLKTCSRILAYSIYEMTPEKIPAPSTANDYNVNDLSSADGTDDEEHPRKTVPKWAEKSALRSHMDQLLRRCDKAQIYAYFGQVKSPQNTKIFPRSTRSAKGPLDETTSWISPIGNPRAAPLFADMQNRKRAKH